MRTMISQTGGNAHGCFVRTTPIIHQDHAKDMLVACLHVQGLTKRVTRPRKESHFQFKVYQATRTKDGRLGCGILLKTAGKRSKIRNKRVPAHPTPTLKRGFLTVIRSCLTARSMQRGAGDDDTRCTPVVTNGDVKPVGKKWVGWVPEHAAKV